VGHHPKLSQLRRKLGQKAKREPEFRFYALYGHLLRMGVLEAAFAQVSSRKGAKTPGVDGVTIDQIAHAEGGAIAYLESIQAELRDKSYRPQPVKRVYIEKRLTGKKRPLGIPTMRDRIVQTAVLLILEPILDSDFLDCSHGFRPGRSAKDAVKEVRRNLQDGLTAVFDADLKSYFDTIPHDKLMTGLEQRVSDRSLLRLIRLILRAPIQEGSDPAPPTTAGVPQGGPLSPLLSNAFLHWFDRAFHSRNGPGTWAGARLVRYADDFVVMARFIDHRIIGYIEDKIETRLGLKLNRAKTRVLQVKDEGLEFLGYAFKRHRSLRHRGHYWRVEASKGSQQRMRDKIRQQTGPHLCFVPVATVVKTVDTAIRGWLNYFTVGHAGQVRWNLIRFAEKRLVRHLRRRSQRPYRPPDGVTLFEHIHHLGLRHATAGSCS